MHARCTVPDVSDEIELIYSRVIADEKLRAGNAYERLAAVVFRILEEEVTVTDMRLTGSSGVAHQIDVSIEKNGRPHRVIVECKDYTAPIGLDLVRSFFGVVEDVKPNAAFMVTTNRFTKDAKKFAANKGIRLAVLKVPKKESDLDGLVLKVHINLNFNIALQPPTVEWVVTDSAEDVGDDFPRESHRDSMVLIDDQGNRRDAIPEIEKKVGTPPLGFEGEHCVECGFDEPTWLEVDGRWTLPVTGFKFRQNWTVIREEVSVGGAGLGVCELVLRSEDGTLVRGFSSKHLSVWDFDEEGTVVPKK